MLSGECKELGGGGSISGGEGGVGINISFTAYTRQNAVHVLTELTASRQEKALLPKPDIILVLSTPANHLQLCVIPSYLQTYQLPYCHTLKMSGTSLHCTCASVTALHLESVRNKTSLHVCKCYGFTPSKCLEHVFTAHVQVL